MSLRSRILWALLGIAWLLQAGTILAADLYKAGDPIEVLYNNKWYPGTVLKTDARGNVMAEYEWGGRSWQTPFKLADVRHAFESGALARARNWSDKAGKFKDKAALIDLDDDKVTLRKPDMTEVTLAVKDLSDADQQYLKRLEKEAGPALQKPSVHMEMENFEGSGLFTSWTIESFAGGTDLKPIVPDPLAKHMKLKQGGVGFPQEKSNDHLGAIIPVGGDGTWLLAAIQNNHTDVPTRLLWASLDRQKIEGRQLLPPREVILDYHEPTHRLLTYSEDRTAGNSLSLWEVKPTDKKAKQIVRWKAHSDAIISHNPWARIVDDDVVVQRLKKQEYVGWDTTAKKVRYRTTQESFFAPLPALSGGRKYLFLPEDKSVRILEAATGKLLSTLPVTRSASSVAVSDDGRQLAVLGSSTVTVWDLTNPSGKSDVYQAESIGTPFTSDMYWVGSDRVIADSFSRGQVLFSLKNKISLWNYQFDMSAVSDHWGERVREVVDRHLVYGATVRSGSTWGLAVGAVLLPGPGVNEAEAALDAGALMIIKPGTAVRIEVKSGENDSRVQKALEAEVAKNGWTISPSATTLIIAEMKQGESQTVTYRFGGFGRPESTESVTVAPFISSLQIKVGDQVAYQSGTSTGAPPIIFLREGQTVQGEVDKWQHPNVEFFEKLDIPDKIMDPTKRNGLGSTEVTNRGLVPGAKR